MPVTLVDRLPLPNLKVYSAGSVLLLSVAVYYAINITSDPNWRASVTQQRQDGEEAEKVLISLESNSTMNLTQQVVEVMTFMLQEPLCMWSVINMSYCLLALLGVCVQRAVFGQLRVAEAQRVRDKFWNYVFYKFIFVFGVLNVQYMDEVLLWCTWFTLVGFLHLLTHLCQDRFEYLSSSPNTSRWAHIRLICLLSCILTAAGALLLAAGAFGLPAGTDIFAFMLAECLLVSICALHVCARYVLMARAHDAASPPAYYTHLVFETVGLCIEGAHVVHMVVHSNMVVSMGSLVLLLQLRHLLHQLHGRFARHRLYSMLHTQLTHYPMASKEEVEKNEDNCAICWEPMKEARKLPCAHLFHNSCLCRWVQQDASCPTCRRSLSPPATPSPPAAGAGGQPEATPLIVQPNNHLFRFDGSRYVSWLPSFSVEVTRVRRSPALADALALQVQQLFPQYPLSTLTADLAATLSADLTVDNILAGRLPPPPAPPVPPVPPVPLAEIMSPSTPERSPTPERVVDPEPVSHGDPLPGVSDVASLQYLTEQHMSEPASFPADAPAREEQLQRRKLQLLRAARARYARRAGPALAHT